MVGVTGSIPVAPTMFFKDLRVYEHGSHVHPTISPLAVGIISTLPPSEAARSGPFAGSLALTCCGIAGVSTGDHAAIWDLAGIT